METAWHFSFQRLFTGLVVVFALLAVPGAALTRPVLAQEPAPSETPTATTVPTQTETPEASQPTQPTGTDTPTWVAPGDQVYNTDDSGPGSLRQAIADVATGGTITFDPALAGNTITLASPISIDRAMTIDGSALDPRVEISGDNAVRLFSISGSVTLRSLVLKDGLMAGWSSSQGGGAIHVTGYPGALTGLDLALRGNQATQGGAIYIDPGGFAQLTGSEFSSNSAESAGAIFASGRLILQNSLIANNAKSAILLSQSAGHLIQNNTFLNNTNTGAGGAIQTSFADGSRILGNLFQGNSAGSAGAISTDRSDSMPIVLENNTFYRNHANTVGGAVSTSGNLTVRNNTFSENQANGGSNSGASLYMNYLMETVALYDNIFANNTGGGECGLAGTNFVTATNNLVEDGSTVCHPTLTGDPLLGSLADDGGPTLGLELLPGSPAIDAGDDDSCSVSDQRGGTRPQGLHCDLGAIETGAFSTSTPTPFGAATPTRTPTPTPTALPLPLDPPYFPAYTWYPSGGAGNGLVSADFNQDGLTDVAMTMGNPWNRLFIYLQNADGTLADPVSYAAGTRPENIATGDLNHDGLADVVVANFDSNTISVFTQKPDGTLAPRVTYATAQQPDGLAVGDLNGDGWDDIAVSHWTSAQIGIFIQNTAGTLDPMLAYASPSGSPDDIAIGDVNNDGRNDVVVAAQIPHLSIYLQKSNGRLAEAVPYNLPFYNRLIRMAVGVGDVTGDGRADVVLDYSSGTGDTSIAVFAQGADGLLQTPHSYTANNGSQALSIDDVNDDGRLDVLTVGYQNVFLFLQQSNGSLGLAGSYGLSGTSSYGHQGIGTGDLDHDGRQDILVAEAVHDLMIFYQSAPPPATSTPTVSPTPTITLTPEATPTWVPSLFQPVIYYDNNRGNSLALGDLNGDGLQDVASIGYGGHLDLFLQKPDGSLEVPPAGSPIEWGVGGVASGDLNHDGRTDLVAADWTTNALDVILQQPDGSLGSLVSYPSNLSNINHLAVGDVTGDGLDDVVAADWSPAGVSVLAQNPDGTLADAVHYTTSTSTYGGTALAIGDVNGDGRADVLDDTYEQDGADVIVSLQSADGTLSSPQEYSFDCPYNCFTLAIATGDVTGDGRTDVIAGYSDPMDRLLHLAVLPQAVDGSLGTPVVYPANYALGYEIRLADVDRDGLQDVVTLEEGTADSTISVYLGQPDGTLAAPLLFRQAVRNGGLEIGDLNHDTWPDLVVAGERGLGVFYGGEHILAPPPTLTPTLTPLPTYTATASATPTASLSLTVSNNADSGPGSLRQAMADILPGGTITFDPSLAGQTITFLSTVSDTKSLTIDGSGLTPAITLDGNKHVQIFSLGSAASVIKLQFLTLKGGRAINGAYGGAIYIKTGTLLIDHVVFLGSNAHSGGAIAAGSSYVNLTVTNSTFLSNSAAYGGGAIDAYNTELTLRNNRFAGNSSPSSGGALQITSLGPDLLEFNTFENNSALNGGAVALIAPSDSVTMRANLFDGNTASANGGAVFEAITGSHLELENNTFHANVANKGGGAYLGATPLILRNNTFSGNAALAAGTNGGSLYLNNLPATLVSVFNNVLADNTAGGECYVVGLTTGWSIGANLIEDGSTLCGPALAADPLLGPLADNGGPTLSMALQPGSPAIDAGRDVDCPDNDQRGAGRPQGAACDLGAYEVGSLVTFTPGPTRTATATGTRTATRTATATWTPPPSWTPSKTKTGSATASATITGTPTISATPSPTGTLSPTPSATITASPSLTPTASATATVSPSPTSTASPSPTAAPVVRRLTFTSAAAWDGWVLESAENGNTGGSLNSTAGVFRLGDDAANRQYRAILSFNTAALPDNARLQSVQLKIRPNGAPVGASPFQSLGRLVFDLRSGWFGVNGALAAADFNTTASLMSAGTFSSSLSAGWYTASLSSSTALGSINRAGVTQLRLRFTKDDNNNRAANYMNFFSGNAAAGQPVLVITYTLP